MKLYILDGHALIFKMYYAFLGRPMVNSKGEDTSIIFGFTKYLLDLVIRERPSHLAVAFDPPGGTFRNQLYPEYKANRAETPQLIIDALDPLCTILKALDIPVLMVKGFEADDVVGSMAKRSASEGFDVYMVTPDKDYGQLIEDHIFMYKPGKGGADKEIFGVREICEKYKIARPQQVIDLLTLCGDSSDNVPGVQGVGPVGAAKLLSKYGTVESIYAHLSELSAKQQEAFKAALPHIALSKQLVTIKTDIPLRTSAEDMKLSSGIGPEILRLVDYYQMRSLLRSLSQIWVLPKEEVRTPQEPDSIFQSDDPAPEPLLEQKCESLNFSEMAFEAFCEKVLSVGAMSLYGDAGTLTLCCEDAVCCDKAEKFRSLLENPAVEKRGYSLKKLLRELLAKGIEMEGRLLDVELLHYILDPERSHQMDMIVRSYLGVDLESVKAPARELSLFEDDPAQSGPVFSSNEAASLYIIAPRLYAELGPMSELYDRIEEPLTKVLARMEHSGVLIDPQSLAEFAEGLRREMAGCEARVREIAGNGQLNVASPKQVGELLFEQLKLGGKVKKSGRGAWPTDEETLSSLNDSTGVVDAILEYRGTRKLLSTYIEPIPAFVSRTDGRVHTTFNQALTATGRLSSSNPNLQNIPIRTEQGREIRKAFVAPKGKVIMSADYSQIELRLMAHFCGDEHMRQAFRQGLDVHKAMAAKIFHKSMEEVTDNDRRLAKTANFGIMYGISSFGLSQRLKISRSEASKLIDDYFASFPSIRQFIDITLQQAREKGYVETLFGRRRYVADVNSRNGNVRAVAERNAVNAPIQGTAADIIKLAMIGVDKALREQGLQSRMVLQIHDELVLEVPLCEIEPVKRILTEQMEGVARLEVPLTVECNYGKNWLEAH